MVSINGSLHSQTFTREKSEAVTPVTGSVEFSSKPGTDGTEIYKAQWHPARIVFDIFGQEARQSLTELLLLKERYQYTLPTNSCHILMSAFCIVKWSTFLKLTDMFILFLGDCSLGSSGVDENQSTII